MGLYPNNCSKCDKIFQWFSGSENQLCDECYQQNKINTIAKKILDENNQLFSDLAFQEQKESLDAQLDEQVRANKMLVDKNQALTEEVRRLNLKLEILSEDLKFLLASTSKY